MRKKIVDGMSALESVEAARERVKRWQERQKEQGRVRAVVWVPVGRVGEIQRLAQELRNKEDDLV